MVRNTMLNMLMIAPSAPPKNAAEAIQVGRYLQALDKHVSGVYCASPPSGTWESLDEKLTLELKNIRRHELRLPFHAVFTRIVQSRYLRFFHHPDSEWWIIAMVNQILRDITIQPDIIYSRSFPFSAAVLALKLKQKTKLPWVMHLSDPWADSDHSAPSARQQALEKRCFDAADGIALTTHGQAEFYREKYPHKKSAIFVSPNVIGERTLTRSVRAEGSALRIVFAGNLYGKRSPEGFVEALKQLKAEGDPCLDDLQVDFYGHLFPEYEAQIDTTSDIICYHGPVSNMSALEAFRHADAILTIEAESTHLAHKSILLVKATDAISMGVPMLSLTAEGSETQRLCEQGYGWAAKPYDTEAISALIRMLVERRDTLRQAPAKAPPPELLPENAVQTLLERMQHIVKASSS